jgi:hypothetical protein
METEMVENEREIDKETETATSVPQHPLSRYQPHPIAFDGLSTASPTPKTPNLAVSPTPPLLTPLDGSPTPMLLTASQWPHTLPSYPSISTSSHPAEKSPQFIIRSLIPAFQLGELEGWFGAFISLLLSIFCLTIALSTSPNIPNVLDAGIHTGSLDSLSIVLPCLGRGPKTNNKLIIVY